MPKVFYLVFLVATADYAAALEVYTISFTTITD